MEENEQVYEKMLMMKNASERVLLDDVFSAIMARINSEIVAADDDPESLLGISGAEHAAAEAPASDPNDTMLFFQQRRRRLAVSHRQYMKDVCRLTGWLRRWGLQGSRVVIATHNAYEQSVALLATLAAGCSFSIFSLVSKREAFEAYLWEQKPAALICGRREAKVGQRYLEKHDIKILQMGDNTESVLEKVYT